MQKGYVDGCLRVIYYAQCFVMCLRVIYYTFFILVWIMCL
jgi:hypothetical protein